MNADDFVSVDGARTHLLELMRAGNVEQFGTTDAEINQWYVTAGLWQQSRPQAARATSGGMNVQLAPGLDAGGISTTQAISSANQQIASQQAVRASFNARIVADFQAAVQGRSMSGNEALALTQSSYPGEDVLGILQAAGITPSTILAPSSSTPVLAPSFGPQPSRPVVVLDDGSVVSEVIPTTAGFGGGLGLVALAGIGLALFVGKKKGRRR